MEKFYLYIGNYTDIDGKYVLKIGTTNNLQRRRREHNFHYKKAKQCTMHPNSTFEYNWFCELSKYNTIRYEDRNKEGLKCQKIGEFVKNDRFRCDKKPDFVEITIRKTYIVAL